MLSSVPLPKMMSGGEIFVLVLQISFHGETFGGIAKCWLFFFWKNFQRLQAGIEKNLKFILSIIRQTALKFSSPIATAYFVKHFLCLCGYLDPCSLCGQVRFRSYFFRSKIYLYEMDETFFKLCTCFQ